MTEGRLEVSKLFRRERPLNLLLAMRLYARVVETRSFTRAAESLKLPKGTGTKLLQQLEKHLNLTLVQRTTRRVLITSGGMAYYERVAQLLQDLDDIESGIGRAQTRIHGTLRVEAPASLSQVLFVPHLRDFIARNPELRLTVGISDRPIDIVSDGVDCVIRCGPLFDQSLKAKRIATLDSVLCAAPSYIQEHGAPAHPRDLDDRHMLVQYANPHSGRIAPVVYIRRQDRIKVVGRSVLTINESMTHFSAGLSGLGIIHTFEFLARPHLAAGRLMPVLPDWRTEGTPVYVVYPPTRHPSARLRAFIDWVTAVCATGL